MCRSAYRSLITLAKIDRSGSAVYHFVYFNQAGRIRVRMSAIPPEVAEKWTFVDVVFAPLASQPAPLKSV